MERWALIINAFVLHLDWGIRELAAETGLPKSAVQRIVSEMTRLGFLSERTADGRIGVGPVLYRLAAVVADRSPLLRIARPVLEWVSEQTGETAVLTLYSPPRRQIWAIDAVESPHPIRYAWELWGDWLDLYKGASGKGVLAFLEPAEREEILARLPDPVPGRVAWTKAELREQFTQARELGYVVTHGERFEGGMGASAPLRNGAGRVIGSLVVSWPDIRTDPERERHYGETARQGARQISIELGYRDHPLGAQMPERAELRAQ